MGQREANAKAEIARIQAQIASAAAKIAPTAGTNHDETSLVLQHANATERLSIDEVMMLTGGVPRLMTELIRTLGDMRQLRKVFSESAVRETEWIIQSIKPGVRFKAEKTAALAFLRNVGLEEAYTHSSVAESAYDRGLFYRAGDGRLHPVTPLVQMAALGAFFRESAMENMVGVRVDGRFGRRTGGAQCQDLL
jgi:hypothetical protein